MNISISAETLFHLGSFPVTNSMLISWLIILVLCTGAYSVSRNLSLVPRGFQNVVEVIMQFLFGIVDSVMGNKEQTKKFFPLIATIFLFIILTNWTEILPGMGAIGLWEEHEGKRIIVPFIRASAADLNFTIALSLISVITIQVVGVMSIGFGKYISKFLNFKSPLSFFVGILELISEAAKLVSFSFRLFGNIFAGEVLLIVMYTLVPYIVPLPFLALELFVGFIQALVFSMLTIVFIKMATEEAHH